MKRGPKGMSTTHQEGLPRRGWRGFRRGRATAYSTARACSSLADSAVRCAVDKCGVCGFRYMPAWSPSCREHVIRHHEWEHGVRLRRLEDFETVGEVEGLKALLVRPTSPLFLRRQA